MTTKRPLFSLAVALAVMLAGVAPAAATDCGCDDGDSLSIAVDQSGEHPVVTVTHNESAVANASVTVAATNNSSYAGDGEYTTDANGTVSLPAPEENVTVEVDATKGNASASTTVELLAADEDDDETPEFDNFGQRVSWFVHGLLDGDIGGGIGGLVSDFVTSNNPGADNKPDHAGPSGDRGPENSTAEGNGHGGPDDHPGNGNGNGGNNGNGDNGNGHGHGDDHPGNGNGKALRSAR